MRFHVPRIHERAAVVVIVSRLDFLFFGYYLRLQINLSTSAALSVVTNAWIQELGQYYVIQRCSAAHVKAPPINNYRLCIIDRRILKGDRFSRILRQRNHDDLNLLCLTKRMLLVLLLLLL